MTHLQVNKTLKLFMLQLSHLLKIILKIQHLVGQDFMHRMWQWGAIVCIFYVLEGTVVHTLDNTSPEIATEELLNKEPKVVGGRPASVGQFPYQVFIRVQNEAGVLNTCGGVIIAEQYVLTAAQCVSGIRAANIKVQAGNIDLRTEENWINSSVSEVYVHDYFPKEAYYNDIALLKLRERFALDGKHTAPLKLRDTEVSAGVLCTVTGWGYTTEGGSFSNIMQYVEVPIVDRKTCSDQLSTTLYPGQICAGYSSGRTDACEGFSGGPLVCEGTLTGLVSWGEGCARPNKSGVYTNVVWYKEWIKERTASFTMNHPGSVNMDVHDVSILRVSNMTSIETSFPYVIFVLSFITLLKHLFQ